MRMEEAADLPTPWPDLTATWISFSPDLELIANVGEEFSLPFIRAGIGREFSWLAPRISPEGIAVRVVAEGNHCSRKLSSICLCLLIRPQDQISFGQS